MPPPITTTSKCWPAIASIAAARESIRRGTRSPARSAAARAAPSPGAGGRGAGGRRSARSSGRPTARAALGRAQQAGGAPVAGVAAGVGAEQDDVGGDRGGVQVLLVLDRVVAEDAGDEDQGRGAVELRRPLGPGHLLQPRQRLGTDDAEAPGRGQVMVRRPARKVEQPEDLLAPERLRAKGLVRAAGPDRGLYVHACNIAARGAPALPLPPQRWSMEGA